MTAPLASAAVPAPTTFDYTGAEQAYVVPAGVSALSVDAVGAPGGSGLNGSDGQGSGAGGNGAQTTGTVPVTPGETLFVEVGGTGPNGVFNQASDAGFNGGGAGNGGGSGGGASDVRTVSCGAGCAGSPASLASRLIVAGGGGGGGGAFTPFPGGDAGSAAAVGGAGSPGQGLSVCPGGAAGEGCELAAGGAAGAGAMSGLGTCGGSGFDGTPGTLGAGGAGGAGSDGGAGGGGGLFGGGGGGGGAASGGGGGGGGSSFGPGGTTFSVSMTAAPSVTITPLPAPAVQLGTANLTFATQAMSSVSAPRTVTITNVGGGPFSVTGASFAGTDPGDFFVGASTCSAPVAAGASCQVTVFFVAQAQGPRTATLDIPSNDPASPATVALLGTGGPPSTGATGSQGPIGPAGPMGATGPQGPAGTVVCRRGIVAQALCAIVFPPGTYTVSASAKVARYTILRHVHRVATGRATVRRGHVTLVRLRALRRGRYQLVITTGSGRHRSTLLDRTIRVD